MPDVNYTITGNVSKGALSQAFAASGMTADMNTTGVMAVTLALGTNVTTITTTTMGALGLCFARSLATTTTHTVSFGRVSGTSLFDTLRLRAGEAAVTRLAPGSYGAKAAVENTRLTLTIFED